VSSELVHLHAAERWSTAVMRTVEADRDPRDLAGWGRHIGASVSTVRAWCYASRIKPKAALDFTRLLRAVVLGQDQRPWDLQNLLDIVDSRTLRRMLARGGIDRVMWVDRAPTIAYFLDAQRFVVDPAARMTVGFYIHRARRAACE
jgi:hypothetical protein